jgi:hypothetical protein
VVPLKDIVVVTEEGDEYGSLGEASFDSLSNPWECTQHGYYDEDDGDDPADEYIRVTDAAVTENLYNVIHQPTTTSQQLNESMYRRISYAVPESAQPECTPPTCCRNDAAINFILIGAHCEMLAESNHRSLSDIHFSGRK